MATNSIRSKQDIIRYPIPVHQLYKGNGIYSCPICGRNLPQTKTSKKRFYCCFTCNIKGIVTGNKIYFSFLKSNKTQKNELNKEKGQASKEENETKRISSLSEQKYYEYIAKHKCNAKRLLPKNAHNKIMAKHKKPSVIGNKTYRKPGRIKFWS